uniref:Glycylpeptide N-tetradecanoyltransferase n=1 Tax=viral metagenome TaxID=1070528 RepID=A0A6C0JNU2_9ZZZZ
MIEYILLVLTITFLTIYAYIKLAYPFWNNQPVFHSYDYWRFFYQTPFYIYKYRPIKTKFCEFNQIRTLPYIDTGSQQRKEICYLLKSNYIQNDRILFTLLENDLDAQYSGHNEPCFLSIYQEKKYELNKFIDPSFVSQYENIVTSLKPIGCVLSRPLHFYYIENRQHNMYTELPIYYIDIICANRELDQKKLNRQLLQTHEYNQRIKNPVIQCSLIKKEIDLFDGVIPLIEYNTYVFYLRNLTFPPLPPHFHCTHVDIEHTDILTDFLYEQTHLDLQLSKKHFEIIAISDVGNFIALIKQNLLHAYCLRNGEHIYGFYFIKDAKMQYEDIEGDTLQIVGSIMNCDNSSLFYSGFLHSMHQIIKKQSRYKMLMFEAISDNIFLLDHWRERNSPVFSNKTAYYTFNLIYPSSPLDSQLCLIL